MTIKLYNIYFYSGQYTIKIMQPRHFQDLIGSKLNLKAYLLGNTRRGLDVTGRSKERTGCVDSAHFISLISCAAGPKQSGNAHICFRPRLRCQRTNPSFLSKPRKNENFKVSLSWQRWRCCGTSGRPCFMHRFVS